MSKNIAELRAASGFWMQLSRMNWKTNDYFGAAQLPVLRYKFFSKFSEILPFIAIFLESNEITSRNTLEVSCHQLPVFRYFIRLFLANHNTLRYIIIIGLY